MLTRKDFDRIACILSYTDIKQVEPINLLLKDANPKFDEIRFWQAVLDYQNGVRQLKK